MELRACNKRRFATKQLADARLEEIDAERPRKPGRKLPIRSYYCRHCGGHHITSQPKRGPSGSPIQRGMT